MKTAEVTDALLRYAGRMHARFGTGHHIASPLGAWLLVALCVRGSGGGSRAELAEALGTEPEAAAELAARLLAEPHPLVASAAAVWHRPVPDAPRLSGWLAALPERVTRGPLPDQAGADAWAREHTLGLIDHFPLRVPPQSLVLLATALATKVSWQTPFDLVPAARLAGQSTAGQSTANATGQGGWAGRVRRALATPDGPGHQPYIAADPLGVAGDLAVHTAFAPAHPPAHAPAHVPAHPPAGGRGTGLWVTSVIAAPEVPAADVLAAAHRLAVTSRPARRSLFDLPLGETPLWTISEERVETTAPGGREERYWAVLPAWSARSEHDLDHPDTGVPAAARALGEVFGLPELRYAARQSAMARYHRTGFEAAAVSGMVGLVSYRRPEQGVRRTARLRFGHPYAVVAVASQQQRGPDGAPVPGPWDGLPVFSAWVAEVEEPDDGADPM